jgi:hypothetical protein
VFGKGQAICAVRVSVEWRPESFRWCPDIDSWRFNRRLESPRNIRTALSDFSRLFH